MARLIPWKTAPLFLATLCLAFVLLQLMPAALIHNTASGIIVDLKRGRASLPGLPFLGHASAKLSEDVNNRGIAVSNGVTGVIGNFLEETDAHRTHIFICTDEMDIRPLVVVINSTISNTREQDQLYFHVVAPEKGHKTWLLMLRAWLPFAKIELVKLKIDIQHISQHIHFRRDNKAREELASPYNFLPFYLPHLFKEFKRIIYLDSDVVVKGDIQELIRLDMEGRAVAAAEDCSQKFEMYFNFDLLDSILQNERPHISWLPEKPIEPKTCIFNRGVLLMDVKQWIHNNLTEAIEWWMHKFRQAERPLYKYGLSQPPFLLALYEKYRKLKENWNVRGLGRNEFSEVEREYMKILLLKKPAKRPFISLLADEAKILHFNGKYKPWKRERPSNSSRQDVSLCGSKAIDCAELWWQYLSPDVDAYLTPFSKQTQTNLMVKS